MPSMGGSRQAVVAPAPAKKSAETLLRRWYLEHETAFTFVAALLIWELTVRALDIAVYLLPAPSVILRELWVRAPLLMRHAKVTVGEILLGYGASITVAIPLAVAISRSRLVEKSIYPLLVSSQFVPKTAVAPLFIIWFGFGVMPKVMLTFLMSFFPLLIDSVVGFKSVSEELEYLARSMGASRLKTFWKIQLPNALPNVFAGLKVSGAFATAGAVVAEFVGSDSGLGYLLLRAHGDFATDLLFAILLVLTGLGYVLYCAVELLERVAIPWHVSQRKYRRE